MHRVAAVAVGGALVVCALCGPLSLVSYAVKRMTYIWWLQFPSRHHRGCVVVSCALAYSKENLLG
jgi:hypothetical protein